MTPLRKRFIEELVLRGLALSTQQAYVAAVYGLARHYHRSPDQINDEEIRNYLLHLHRQQKSGSTINQVTSGLKFFYLHVLQRPLAEVERAMPRNKKAIRRPQVFSSQEIERLLGHANLDTTAVYLHVRQDRLASIKSPLDLLDLTPLPAAR